MSGMNKWLHLPYKVQVIGHYNECKQLYPFIFDEKAKTTYYCFLAYN